MGDVYSKNADSVEACCQFSTEEYALYKQMYLKCCDRMGGRMKKSVFYDVVIADLFPAPVAEFLFYAFSGNSDGISLDNLLKGIASLSRVSCSDNWKMDRIKMLFQVLSTNGQGSSFVNKVKMLNLFRAIESQERADRVRDFVDKFSLSIDYEVFESWVFQNSEQFTLTRWLLWNEVVPGFELPTSTSDLFAVPTLYGTIAKITHLDEREIALLEKHFSALCGSNRVSMDFSTFHSLVCPPIADEITRGFFNAFDSNRDETIDFNEYVCGLSACCRGPLTERRKFLFRIFDFDSDGMLSKAEIFNLVDICLRMRCQFSEFSKKLSYPSASSFLLDSASVIQDIMQNHDPDQDGYVHLEDFLVWAERVIHLDVFCDLVDQVCHVVFGLKPINPEYEGVILKSYMKREKSLLTLGSKWFIIPQQWWLSWIAYTTCNDLFTVDDNFGVKVNKTIPFPQKSVSATNSPLRSRKMQKINASWKKREHHYTVNPLPEDQKPLGAIDTSKLVSKDKLKAPQLTSVEILKNESDSKYECIPAAVWRCLVTWYGSAGPPIERVVIRDQYKSKGVKIETHPLVLNLYHHTLKSPSIQSVLTQQVSATIGAALTMTGQVSGTAPTIPPLLTPFSNSSTSSSSNNISSISSQNTSYPTNNSSANQNQVPNFKRTLTRTVVLSQDACISDVRTLLLAKFNVRNEDMRLWHFKSEDCLILLNDDSTTLSELDFQSGDNLLLEIRQPSGWPEVMIQCPTPADSTSIDTLEAYNDDNFDSVSKTSLESRAGQAGLHNIGNTCFMNSALQCLSHTYALTSYFLRNCHFYELNTKGRDGSQGQVALCYGHLLEQLWSESNSVVKPAVIRDCIVKHRSQFNNSNQHDAQEMLEAVLDLLHEDLNRVTEPKTYHTLNEAEGREDYDVAEEQWGAHVKNNNSVIVDLFTGQMQSKITCSSCGRWTSKFDVFNVLSLSIPADTMTIVYVLLQRLDGQAPTRYALRVGKKSTYGCLKQELGPLCNLSPSELVFVETNNRYFVPSVPGVPIDDDQKLKNHASLNYILLAFQTVSNTPTHSPDTPLLGTPSISNDSLSVSAATNKTDLDLPNSGGSEEAVNSNHLSTSGDNIVTTSLYVKAPESPTLCTQTALDASVSGCTGSKSKTNSLSPCPAVSLTPSSSGYASDTWKPDPPQFLFAVHCKQSPNSAYFLWQNRTKMTFFGRPVLVPVVPGSTNADIYSQVEAQVARFVINSPVDQCMNHAKDCDDLLSISGAYPFVLRKVAIVPSHSSPSSSNTSSSYSTGSVSSSSSSSLSSSASSHSFKCWTCPWYNVCKGCSLELSDDPFELPPSPPAQPNGYVSNGSAAQGCSSSAGSGKGASPIYVLVIEWEPTIIHLRFNFAAENELFTHVSVEQSETLHKQPLNLDDCLKLLTKEQIITDFSPCPKCKATKIALTHHIWRCPPHLIVHLKRYEQPMNGMSGRWIKSHKRVSFPIDDLNMLPHVSSGAHLLNKQLARVLSGMEPLEVSRYLADDKENGVPNGMEASDDHAAPNVVETDDYFKYRLFSVSCHSGNLTNGHYVSVCRNPLTQKWYCFNDNSCKEVPVSSIPLDTTYLLFYELSGVDTSQFLPNIDMKQPVINPNEFRKAPANFISSASLDGRKNCRLM